MHQDSLATAAITLEPALETSTSRASLLTHLKSTSNASNGAHIPIRAAFEMLECALALRLQRSDIPGPPCLEALLTLCSSLPTHTVRDRLAALHPNASISGQDGAQIDRLWTSRLPTIVVMNPPFSRDADGYEDSFTAFSNRHFGN